MNDPSWWSTLQRATAALLPPGVGRRLRFLFHRDRLDADLAEEMRFHLDMQADENRDAGMDADEAQYAARRQFGNATRLKESSREAWGWSRLEDWWQDWKHAARSLRKSPAFTAVAVLTLALGIGANTAVFSVVNAVLLRPLPMRDPERLVMIWEKWEKHPQERTVVAAGNYYDWKQQSTSFEQMGVFGGGGSATMTAGDEPVQLPAASATAGFLDTAGVTPVMGRAFLPEEERAGDRVVMLSYGLWQRLGADRSLPGKTIQLYRQAYTVAGIMPPGFNFPYDADVWLLVPASQLRPGDRGTHSLRVLGRLKPGVSVAQAQSELDTIAARLKQAYPERNPVIGVTIVPLQEQVVGEVRHALVVLLGAVACVLLIACANVANLLLARAKGRQREIAMRLTLGASRWRVARYVLAESVLLSLAGGALGLFGAYWGVSAFAAFDPIKLPRVHEIAVDRTVLLFTFLLAVFTGVLFGLAPAMRGTKRVSLGVTSRDFHPMRGRGSLAAAQVALAIVLLVAAGLLLRSFVRRVTVPLGFRPNGVLAVQLPWSVHRRMDELLGRIRALPGVEATGAATCFPNAPAESSGGFEIEGRPARPGEELIAGWIPVTPDYFRAAGMTLLKGRLLAFSDGQGAPDVVVINQALARRYLPGEDPIGRRIRFNSKAFTVVGVAGDAKGFGLDGDPQPAIYLSYKQTSWGNPVYVLIRTAVPPASLAGTVRKELRAWNKNLMIEKLAPMDDLLADSVAVPRFYMLLVVLFASLALAVAAIGVYGVINYSVAQRTHEIGVRMALGAERSAVLHMVLSRGLGLILAGIGLGLAGAWASTRVLESLLFQVRPNDAFTFLVVALVLIGVGLLACYVPARRATKIDPMEALRYE